MAAKRVPKKKTASKKSVTRTTAPKNAFTKISGKPANADQSQSVWNTQF